MDNFCSKNSTAEIFDLLAEYFRKELDASDKDILSAVNTIINRGDLPKMPLPILHDITSKMLFGAHSRETDEEIIKEVSKVYRIVPEVETKQNLTIFTMAVQSSIPESLSIAISYYDKLLETGCEWLIDDNILRQFVMKVVFSNKDSSEKDRQVCETVLAALNK